MANTLSTNLRLLHHIIRKIFISKTSRFDFVSKRELVLMYHMMLGIPMSLSGMMLIHMREAVESLKVCLPYGMLLTWVF